MKRQYGMRLPVLLVQRVEAHARIRGLSRTAAVEQLLETALDAEMERVMESQQSTSVTLSETETALWEDDGDLGEDFRGQVRAREWPAGRHIEVYSHDGITLDAWEA